MRALKVDHLFSPQYQLREYQVNSRICNIFVDNTHPTEHPGRCRIIQTVSKGDSSLPNPRSIVEVIAGESGIANMGLGNHLGKAQLLKLREEINIYYIAAMRARKSIHLASF